MEEEIWKDIPGYEGLYQASSSGRIRVLDRTVWRGPLGYCVKKGHLLTQCKITPRGTSYYYVHLYKSGKRRGVSVAVLVCATFNGPKPKSINGSTRVDCMHLNGDSFDNRPENLAWGTHLDNMREPNCRRRISEGQFFKNGWVIQMTKEGEEVGRYPSVRDASDTTGIHKSNIATCARGFAPSAGGYKWKYEKDYKRIDKRKRQ